MNILITQGKSSLAAALAGRLSADHSVRLTDVDDGDGVSQCGLGHDSATDDLVQGVDAIIHIGYNAVDSGDRVGTPRLPHARHLQPPYRRGRGRRVHGAYT